MLLSLSITFFCNTRLCSTTAMHVLAMLICDLAILSYNVLAGCFQSSHSSCLEAHRIGKVFSVRVMTCTAVFLSL